MGIGCQQINGFHTITVQSSWGGRTILITENRKGNEYSKNNMHSALRMAYGKNDKNSKECTEEEKEWKAKTLIWAYWTIVRRGVYVTHTHHHCRCRLLTFHSISLRAHAPASLSAQPSSFVDTIINTQHSIVHIINIDNMHNCPCRMGHSSHHNSLLDRLCSVLSLSLSVISFYVNVRLLYWFSAA